MRNPWLSLHRCRGISTRVKRDLLESNGFDPVRTLKAAIARGGQSDNLSDQRIMDRVKQLGAWIMDYGADDYPELLRQIPDPPLCLYGLGNRELLQLPKLAFVGTRRATPYGFNACERLISEMACMDICIVSGLAAGIDTRAHQAALSHHLPTLAVLGTGPDIVYPRTNRKLFQEICRHGAILTEYDPGTPPIPARFPVRNRIISGLSLGVVVVEARDRSGSMITLRLALEQNREVFAVPGRLFDRASVSTNRRIQRGEAKLVLEAGDILEEFPGFDKPQKSATVVPESSGGVLSTLAEAPRSLDELAVITDLPRNQLLMELTLLEMNGTVEKDGANRFRKRV